MRRKVKLSLALTLITSQPRLTTSSANRYIIFPEDAALGKPCEIMEIALRSGKRSSILNRGRNRDEHF